MVEKLKKVIPAVAITALLMACGSADTASSIAGTYSLSSFDDGDTSIVITEEEITMSNDTEGLDIIISQDGTCVLDYDALGFSGEVDMDSDIVEGLIEAGLVPIMDMEFVFEEDGTFYMSAYGESAEGSWDEDDDGITISGDNINEAGLETGSDGSLILSIDGAELVLSKGTDVVDAWNERF